MLNAIDALMLDRAIGPLAARLAGADGAGHLTAGRRCLAASAGLLAVALLVEAAGLVQAGEPVSAALDAAGAVLLAWVLARVDGVFRLDEVRVRGGAQAAEPVREHRTARLLGLASLAAFAGGDLVLGFGLPGKLADAALLLLTTALYLHAWRPCEKAC